MVREHTPAFFTLLRRRLLLFSVVNHIWEGSIVQKNNENHDIDCRSSVISLCLWLDMFVSRCL